MLLISSVISSIFMVLFVFYHGVLLFPLLAVIGFFMFATGPVLLASVQDLNSGMPTFANSIYMSVNFGVGSVVVYIVGKLGDTVGLNETYKIAAGLSFFCIIFVFILKRVQKKG